MMRRHGRKAPARNSVLMGVGALVLVVLILRLLSSGADIKAKGRNGAQPAGITAKMKGEELVTSEILGDGEMHSIDVAVVIPKRSVWFPDNYWKYLLGERGSHGGLKVRLFVVANEVDELNRLKEVIREEEEVPISYLVAKPLATKRHRTSTYAEMCNAGLEHAMRTTDAKLFLLLSPTRAPTSPTFIPQLVNTMAVYPNAGIAGCTTLMESPGENEKMMVLDRGYVVELGHGDAGEPRTFVSRHRSGFSTMDTRDHEVTSVAAVDPYCMMLRRAIVKQQGGLRVSASLSVTDQIINGYMDEEVVNMKVTLLQHRLLKVELAMDKISVKMLNENSEQLRAAVRDAYNAVTEGTALWESITKRQWSHDAKTDIEEGVEDEDLRHVTTAVLLGKLTEKAEVLIAFLRDFVTEKNSAAHEEESGWDFCLNYSTSFDARKQQMAPGRIIVSNATVIHSPRALPIEIRSFLSRSTALQVLDVTRSSFVVSGHFANVWEKLLRDNHPARIDFVRNGAPPIKIFWDAFCCSCCGFANEIVHFVWPLQRVYDVSLLPGPQCFCPGFPRSVESSIAHMHVTREAYVTSRSSDNELALWISHTDPTSYKNYVFAQRAPSYIIGRSMYEFTKIDSNWVAAANSDCDEIWVPAVWVRKSFIASGVKSEKLVVIPEAIDTNFFDPKAQAKIELPPLPGKTKWRTWCNKDAPEKAFKFFSNFKWEPRKGWDILFEAYFQAFEKDSAVSLYVLTHIWFSGGPETYGDPHNTTYLRLELEAFLRKRHNLSNDTDVDFAVYPHFCFLCAHLSEVQVAEVYNSVDAFVLPTRGEGWGLPAIQAMSMGLPTITTNWGGQMEFLTAKNSFRIPLDAVEEIPEDSVYRWRLGKKWAKPSLNATASFMKTVAAKPAYAKRIGAVARQWVVKHFSEEALLEGVTNRLALIVSKLTKAQSKR